MSKTKEKAIIGKFQSILRSGKDYDVKSMYEDAGSSVFITGKSAKRIVNNYYRGVITKDMIQLVNSFNQVNGYLKKEYVDLFSKTFNVCERESRLLIRYVKYAKP